MSCGRIIAVFAQSLLSRCQGRIEMMTMLVVFVVMMLMSGHDLVIVFVRAGLRRLNHRRTQAGDEGQR